MSMEIQKKTFRDIIIDVEQLYSSLIISPVFKCARTPVSLNDKAGIYLFSEYGKPLYVGRSDNLRKRLASHRHRSHNTATFAFLIARHETGILDATYQSLGSRTDLLKNDPVFSAAFDKARERIGSMDVQVIEVTDPVRQALLEIYAAFVSEAAYNDFENH